MTILKLAMRNLIGARLRTWLNVTVLSFSFVAIIWSQGFNDGMNEQASRAMMDSEIGGGQFWQADYDPYDPLSIQDAHAPIPPSIRSLIDQDKAAAILLAQATIYPQGRLRPAVVKGISPDQKVIDIPTTDLQSTDNDVIPAVIGSRMAKNSNLKIGDTVTIRWRDADGTFDAREAQVMQIMNTTVSTIDNGQLWIPLPVLQKMLGLHDEATLVVIAQELAAARPVLKNVEGWEFKDLAFLLRDINELTQRKTISSTFFYAILLALAMLAIFDTQVLSIFRRRKEIGTLISLGMTRTKVIQLFTLEGSLHGILAAFVGAVYGIPLCVYFASRGFDLPKITDSYGLALGQTLYPAYSAALVGGTTIIVMVVVTIISFLPTRQISKLKPTDALRGKSI